MSRVQKMRQFVAQRLHAAAEEILAVFEKTIDKYEQEAALNHEVISRQHALLCALHSPLVDLKSTDVFTQQLMVSKDAAPLEDKNQNQDQDKNQTQDQDKNQTQQQNQDQDKNQTQQQNQDPEPSQETEEQDGEQLHLDEDDIIKFTYSSRCAVMSGGDLDPSARPGPAGPEQDVLLVSSSETEDSEDYNRDSMDPRPAPDRQKRRGARSSFTCRVCRRTFNARRFLVRHARTHLQEASLVCGVCGESFEAADSLKLHLETHLKKSLLQNQNKTETGTRTCSSVRQNSNTNVQQEQKPNRCEKCGKEGWKKRRHRCQSWRTKQNLKDPEETKKKKKKT